MTYYATLAPDPAQAARWAALRAEIEAAGEASGALLREVADDCRREILKVISATGLGHVGGDLSVIDILVCLYFALARVDPSRPGWEDRDRVVLSKGHASVSFYVTLSRCGFFPQEALSSFAGPFSPLNGHPDRRKVPGVEASTGPLGHGLPFSVGAGVAAQITGSARRAFVVLGDGELQEGSNWEAAMLAAHRQLGNLTAIVDRNGLQQGAGTEETNRLEPLAEKWRSFGWEVDEVDGHDHAALLEAMARAGGARPRCVIAHTVKGKGVSFMEGEAVWHHRVPTTEERDRALLELRS